MSAITLRLRFQGDAAIHRYFGQESISRLFVTLMNGILRLTTSTAKGVIYSIKAPHTLYFQYDMKE